jgi:hypothetical protein
MVRLLAILALSLTLAAPLAHAAKSPAKKNRRSTSHVRAITASLTPPDFLVVDGLNYPVPRNIDRRPGILPGDPKNVTGPVYTAVDPHQ